MCCGFCVCQHVLLLGRGGGGSQAVLCLCQRLCLLLHCVALLQQHPYRCEPLLPPALQRTWCAPVRCLLSSGGGSQRGGLGVVKPALALQQGAATAAAVVVPATCCLAEYHASTKAAHQLSQP